MSPNLRIAYRFLTAKKRSMLMSLSCTVLGVGLFIVSQATTSGFQGFFIDTILGNDGAIMIKDQIQTTATSLENIAGSGFAISTSKDNVRFKIGIDEPAPLIAQLESNFPSVIGVSELVQGSSSEVHSASRDDTGRVLGINLEEHLKVSDLARKIVAGSLDNFRDLPFGSLVGRELADRLQLSVDDTFSIKTSGGQTRTYHVSGIYATGISAVDRERIYLSMSDARSLLQKRTGASALQIRIANPEMAIAESLRIQEVLGFNAQPWQEREKSWLSAFSALQISSAITVSVFTLIAGLAMFNTLAMIVIEKTKDIAILRSMGYERSDVTRIFIWQAVIVLVIGAALGSLFGAAATYGISQMPLPKDGISGIFATKYFIVAWSPWHYAEAIGTAVVTVMLASIIPARRAARLEPGDIVRGTAQ